MLAHRHPLWIRYLWSMRDITRIANRVRQGELPPDEELLPLVYEELRKIAAHKMAREAPGQTLQPTALVHEAWLRLGADAQPEWQNRAHFFAAGAEAMRRILVERARRRTALKRGGGADAVSLDAGLKERSPSPMQQSRQARDLSAKSAGQGTRSASGATAVCFGET